jgi:type I site-specific restriction endonuclease
MSFERHFETRCDTYELNTCMYRYQVYVKIKGSMVKTIIFADNDIHARLLAQYQYGMNNVSIPPQRIGN